MLFSCRHCPLSSPRSCPQVLLFEHASPLSDFRPKKKRKKRKGKKWRRKTKSRRRRIWRRLEQKLVLEYGLEYVSFLAYPSLHETVQRLFRTVALGLDGNQGHRELFHRDLTSEDGKWFSILNHLLGSIFLEGSCCLIVTGSRYGNDIQYRWNIVVIKIRAILLRFVAATKGSLTRYNTSRKTSVYNIQETDTLCYPCHQCWPTRSAKNRSLLISCFLVVSCSIVSISLINQPEKKL